MDIGKLQKGDTVEIVEYGNLISFFIDGKLVPVDTMKNIVGMVGTVDYYDIKTRKYAVKGIPGKYACYNREQLKQRL